MFLAMYLLICYCTSRYDDILRNNNVVLFVLVHSSVFQMVDRLVLVLLVHSLALLIGSVDG
jgi:hypothetical protein